jgi:hypothetical protein
MDTCPICTRSIYSPYRVYDDRGHVIQGCVDKSHTGHLVTPSESARWHHRPEAKQIRAHLAQRGIRAAAWRR